MKSFDPAQHAFVGAQLTNRQIDAYQLHGRYGEKKRQALLAAIQRGAYRGLDARIRKGEFGAQALSALNKREASRPRKAKPSLEELRQSVIDAGFDPDLFLYEFE